VSLPSGHTDIEREEHYQAYVVSFFDPDLGGGFQDYARSAYAVNVLADAGHEDNFAFLATCKVNIPASGDWTFAFLAGDKFKLRIGGNTFLGDGTLQTGPSILSRFDEGTLTALPGGSGETFYFPSAGIYDLYLTTFEAGFAAYIQMFAAPGNLAAFNTGRVRPGGRRAERGHRSGLHAGRHHR
jgi:hypothetical protein